MKPINTGTEAFPSFEVKGKVIKPARVARFLFGLAIVGGTGGFAIWAMVKSIEVDYRLVIVLMVAGLALMDRTLIPDAIKAWRKKGTDGQTGQ